ncbi:hypothetical protein SADUNF_Sadunf01G0004400 [Salix dunnii]|uniref:Uncharacterized protein n=1 Tax=Salix dunnii TaxID=1413687 RepID=A0A835TLD8_9ROSI|nr:hypothetical protein SADUNF_Sadunf01G0004400 [Salix dunnii]
MDEEIESTALPSYFSHSLEGCRSRLMSTPAQTELYTKEMKKRKKRETDRRYRQKMKVNASLSSTAAAHHETAVQETKNQLAMTIIENENLKRAVEELRQVILHLTSQRELIEQRLTFQLCYLYSLLFSSLPFLLWTKQTAVQETQNQLAMTIIENENLKRAVEELRQEIFLLTSERQFIEQRFNTIYTELEKEIECVRAAAEGFGEQRA